MEAQNSKKCSCTESCEFDVAEGLENFPVYYNGKSCVKTWKSFKYVSRCIPGPGCSMEEFEAKYEGCQCKAQSCSPANCLCILRFGMTYSDEGTLLKIEQFQESTDQKAMFCCPILECGLNCLCGPGCSNRLVQHGLKYRTEVFDTGSNKGLGLKACELIKKGAFLCEYAGEIIGLLEAKRRAGLLQANGGMNYILVLREHYNDQIAEVCVDPTKLGNLGRFINHSCDPNLWMTAVRFSNAVPKLCLFARRDINIGEEFTFHYGGHEEKVCDAGPPREHRSTELICHCASDNCTGYLPFEESLYDSA